MENEEVVPVTKARENLADIIGKVKYGHKRIKLTSNGKIVGVIIPLEDLELLEAIEDKIDIEVAERAINDGKTYTFNEVLQDMVLTRQGLDNSTPMPKSNSRKISYP